MGCDIGSIAEVKKDGKWEHVNDLIFANKTNEPFGDRDYRVFAFLANIRNTYGCPSINRISCFPEDSEYLNTVAFSVLGDDYTNLDCISDDNHHQSHIYLSTLLSFNYDQVFFNKEKSKDESVRCFLSTSCSFFDDLRILNSLGDPDDVRIVYYFNS